MHGAKLQKVLKQEKKFARKFAGLGEKTCSFTINNRQHRKAGKAIDKNEKQYFS